MTASQNASDQQKIEAFVLRARRIAAHSLVVDRERLQDYAEGVMWFQETTAGTALEWDLPAEEVFESLAARIRPLILKNDDVQFGKVLNALAHQLVVTDNKNLMPVIAQHRIWWNCVDPELNPVAAFSVSASNSETADVLSATDAALALGWFYGDLVHAGSDEKHQHAAALGIELRYSAAVTRVAQMAELSQRLLQVVMYLHEIGTVSLSAEILEQAVSAPPEGRFRIGAGSAKVAPSGTEVPPDLQNLGSEWAATRGATKSERPLMCSRSHLTGVR